MSPYAQIGWTSSASHSGDPRVPVTCWVCLGWKVLHEVMDAERPWELLPVQCFNCEGKGLAVRERRRVSR